MRRAMQGRGRGQSAHGASVLPPVGGWDAVSSLADMPPDRAPVLDNWFPSTSDVRVRRGYRSHAFGMGAGAVDSLLVYNGVQAAATKLFAATGGTLYDVSASGPATAAVTGLLGNRWQGVNFTNTAGDKFLWICNGLDTPRHFNGNSWQTAALSGLPAPIANVNAHKRRLWFVFKDSTVAGYLVTEAIGGAVTQFDLGPLFTKGGHLVAMATWTKDGGAGEDDFAVFISSRGQVAVYAGTDPNDPASWALVGVYDVGAPIGSRCFTKVAGDLALINIDGVLPLSRALGQDRGAASAIAITRNINNAMNEAARSYAGNFGWELVPYPKGTMAILNVPIQEGQTQNQYVMNTLTGAWCRFVGMNANCWAVFRDNLYFGGNAGLVYQADTSGNDGVIPIDAVGQTAYHYYRARGELKAWKMLQPLLTTDSDARPSVGISTDFKDNAVLGTPSAAAVSAALYETAVCETAVYPVESRTIPDRTTVSRLGQCASILFRAQTGKTLGAWGSGRWGSAPWASQPSGDVIMRLNGFHVLYEPGGIL